MATEKQKQKIVDALMELAADRDFLAIDLNDVADKAGVSLGQLRASFDSRVAILEEFSRRIDLQVLGDEDPAMASEPLRERLFDVIMRRLDALAPYRASLRRLMQSARRDLMLAATLNRIAVTSQRWMLAAAGVKPSGPLPGLQGYARAQAMALAYARILPVWLEEEDPNLPKTMAALDKQLRGLERFAGQVKKAEDMLDGLVRRRDRRGSRRAAAPKPPEPDLGEAVGV
jgi:AcrR family transcriptional regulator